MLAKLCRSACGFRYETPAAFSTFFQVRSSRVPLIGHRRDSIWHPQDAGNATRRVLDGLAFLTLLSALWVRRSATSARYLGRRFRGVRSRVA